MHRSVTSVSSHSTRPQTPSRPLGADALPASVNAARQPARPAADAAVDSAFAALKLAPPLLRALAEEGYSTPTPIQTQAIPPALEGRDLLGSAQTGSGKTAAFALPIIQRLMASARTAGQPRGRGSAPRALILAPTRELAIQIAEGFSAYGRHAGLSHVVVYGGVSQVNQVRGLERGADVVVATPGRLIDLMEQRVVDLSKIEILVLDEADRMLDMGFIVPVRRIAAALPAKRQTMLFSATMPPEIRKLADSLLRQPVKVAVNPVASTVPTIDQSVCHVNRAGKQPLLAHLLEEGDIGRAIVFTRTKHGADKVSKKLNEVGISADAIHGNKAQNRRQRTLESFRSGQTRVLVATDVAARGLDIDEISHVFNFDLPHEPEAYVHRIGRTARAGASGIAIAFCDREEQEMLRDIERLIGSPLRVVTDLPKFVESANARGPAPSASAPRPSRGPARGSAGRGPRHDGRGQGAPSAGHAPRGGQPPRAGSPDRAPTTSAAPHAGRESAPRPAGATANGGAGGGWRRARGARR